MLFGFLRYRATSFDLRLASTIIIIVLSRFVFHFFYTIMLNHNVLNNSFNNEKKYLRVNTYMRGFSLGLKLLRFYTLFLSDMTPSITYAKYVNDVCEKLTNQMAYTVYPCRFRVDLRSVISLLFVC